MENRITYKVYGTNALFTDPVTKTGGEKMSLMVPTYQALVGITESIYWKPSIKWVIDEVRVMNPIRTESKGIRPIKYGGGNDLAYYTYLTDVEYQVKAHFEFNYARKDLEADFNENKHYFIAKRCVERGGRRDIFLGTRECQGYVEACEYMEGEGFYDHYGEMSLGMQFFGFSYPDDNGEDRFFARFWTPVIKDGIIRFGNPKEHTTIRELHKFKMKKFTPGENFSGINEEGLLSEYEEGTK
ncbi:MAG: type I-C CRISPR-associated protein Cas5c [Anaerovoracaceae bacterium]